MFIPTHFPQSEMFRPIADELLNIKNDVLIQVIDIHPQHQGIIAFNGSDDRFKIIRMLHNYEYVFLFDNINIISRLVHYSNLKKRLLICRTEIKELLNDYKPDIIVLGHDTMILHKIFIDEAFNKNIPTLLVQEGTIATSYNQNFSWTFSGRIRTSLNLLGRKIRNELFPATNQEKYGHGGTTKIAVWGNYTKNLLIAENVDASKIVVTGSPRYDKLCELRVNKKKIMQKIGLSNHKNIIVYIDQRLIQNRIFSEKEAYKYTGDIFKAVLQLPETQLVVKLREGPGKDVSLKLTNRVIKNIKCNNEIVVTDKYLYELLDIAEVVIIFSSTVGMEAILLDKPVVSVNFSGFEPYPYVKSGAVLGCASPEDILPAIKKSLYGQTTKHLLAEKRKNFIYDHLYKRDGKTSERIANLIIQMVNNKI